MNVLLACPGIFDQIGGGQRFYANLIRSNPTVDFCCFGLGQPGPGVPRNVHFIVATDVHIRQVGDFHLGLIPRNDPAVSLKHHPDELARLLDLAASVPAVQFDIVDIPDFLPLAVYFPECLKYFGIEFEKVVLSMHGTLSMGLLENWADQLGDLTSLIEHEQLLYRYCDLRYGIGYQYIAEWEQSCGLPAHLLDISKVYDLASRAPSARRPRTARAATRDAPPDLCFIGRQEKWKGPDLFLELCSRLPRDAFGEVRFYGPTVALHGHNSMEELERLARHRSLEIAHEVLAADDIVQRMRDERMVAVLPSRRDTFNLVAIEALLSGCPAIVSTACGACDFLDTAYPNIPYVRLDPGDLLGCYDAVLDLLSNYDAARAALAEYLKTATPQNYGESLDRIYAETSEFDPTARAIVEERFQALSEWLESGFLKRAGRASASAAVERCQAVLSSYGADAIEAKLAEAEFLRAVDVVRVWQDCRPNSTRPTWAAVDRALDRLSGHVFGGSRANLYRLMAEWERSRGNDLLYATYWLRVMRLTGRIPQAVLTAALRILDNNGFRDAAAAAQMLYRNDDDEIYRYLSQRCRQFRAPPEGELAEFLEINRPAAPKVSVIVSVYNGAGKINTFVSGLERFTAEEKSIAEFIFVDSASLDDTGSVLTERLQQAASRGIGALYIRSRERETIQRAWNRGIAAARGEYLGFLGVDEMNRPDSLAKMAAFLDRRRDIDWVQGSAVITEVNAAGSYVRDVMAYDRTFDSQHVHYLECCYISYVGALYRKAIHDRVGFYDDAFRAAGDTEFKNRALPFIRVETLPETFGTFLNYPEARTTQSPAAELEDFCAWHLHRTAGGVRYALEGSNPEDCVRQFRRALHYKKSYMERVCSDVEYAWSIAEYLRRHRPGAFAGVEHFVPNLLGLRLAYERLDEPVNPELSPGAKGFEAIGAALEHVWFAIAHAYSVHKLLGLPAQYQPAADNRWHQHHLLWPSTTRRGPAEAPVADDAQAALDEAPDEPSVDGANPPLAAAPRLAAASDAPFEIDLSRPIGGSGWHHAESTGGNWYRWTGPQPRFELELLLTQGRSYTCEMVMTPVRADVFDGFAITVNDVDVPYDVQSQSGTIRLSFSIPSTLNRSNAEFCRIVFRHNSVYSPSEDGGGDARKLGFAVRWISFSPAPDEAGPDLAAAMEPVQPAPAEGPPIASDTGSPNGADGTREETERITSALRDRATGSGEPPAVVTLEERALGTEAIARTRRPGSKRRASSEI